MDCVGCDCDLGSPGGNSRERFRWKMAAPCAVCRERMCDGCVDCAPECAVCEERLCPMCADDGTEVTDDEGDQSIRCKRCCPTCGGSGLLEGIGERLMPCSCATNPDGG